MPQFTVTSVAYGQALTSAKVNSIISRAKASFNRLDTTNFPASCVPLTALQTRYSVCYLTLEDLRSISSTTTMGTRVAYTGYLPVPSSFSIVSVAVVAPSVVASAGNTVKILLYSATALSYLGSAAMTAANTYTAMTMTTTAVPASVLLEIRYQVTGAGGSIAYPVVVIQAKKLLST